MSTTDNDQAASTEFRRLGEKLWGYGWQQKAARHFEVSDRSVRHWVAGARVVPPNVLDELRVMVDIAPPPHTTAVDDRDDACRDALEPALTELRNRAISAGWHPAEVATAILALTVDEIRIGAGDAATVEILNDTLVKISEGQ
jgi:hypothetical protein